MYLSILLSVSLAAMPKYHLDHRIQLSGNEGWDYLTMDSKSDRLFVTRGNHVDVFNVKTETLVGSIKQFIDGAHGVALAPQLGKGYISSGKNSSVVVFDYHTLKILKTIPAGKKADAIVFDPLTSRVFCFNGEKTITVIDAIKDESIKTIALDSKPEFAAADEKGNIYFNGEDTNTLLKLRTQEMVIQHSWPLAGCQSPSGLAADFANHLIFSVCENEVMVVTDSETGRQIQKLPIGQGADFAAFDAGFSFSSNGQGNLTVVQEKDPQTFEVIQTVNTLKSARTMAIDPKTHTIYLVAAKFETAAITASGVRPKIIPETVEILVLKK